MWGLIMHAPVLRLVSLMAALGLIAACSKSTGSSPRPSAAGASGRPSAMLGNACERKLLTADDVAGILSEPITGTKPLKGDSQTCYFITAATESQGGPEIMISVRPGLGRVTVQTWEQGRMGIPAVPIHGIGESAVWIAATKEVDAQKNDLLCVAGVGGSALIEHFDDLQKKLGGLCNTIFARSS